MAFYIKPARGSIQLAELQSLLWQRLHFLMSVANSDGRAVAMKDLVEEVAVVEGSDGLIEGSPKDTVSHFVLRLACAQDPEMEKFLLSSEMQLFNYRFSCMKYDEMVNCIKPLRRLLQAAKQEQVPLCDEYADVVTIGDWITAKYSWRQLLEHYANCHSSEYFQLPFIYVTDLVRARKVCLKDGLASVPCTKLSDILTTMFKAILKRGCILARKVLPSVIQSDSRMASVFKSIKTFFRRHYRAPHGAARGHCVVTCEDIEELTDTFPLCMSHLHRQLRSKHRLRHFSRIQYTLFLKEVGLPVHESIHFWKTEYSQAPCTSTKKPSCHHRWETDAHRYTYSIRHLYGLEGSRTNYRGHCCSLLQTHSLGHGEDGGCPFKHFDRQHLVHALQSAGIHLDNAREIVHLAKECDRYSEACRSYMSAKLWRSEAAAEPAPSSARTCVCDMSSHHGADMDVKAIDGKCEPISKSNSSNSELCTDCVESKRNANGECVPDKYNCMCHCTTKDITEIGQSNGTKAKSSRHNCDKPDHQHPTFQHDSKECARCQSSLPESDSLPNNSPSHLRKLNSAKCLSASHPSFASTDIRQQIQQTLHKTPIIHKPVDYLVTYKELLEGLQ